MNKPVDRFLTGFSKNDFGAVSESFICDVVSTIETGAHLTTLYRLQI